MFRTPTFLLLKTSFLWLKAPSRHNKMPIIDSSNFLKTAIPKSNGDEHFILSGWWFGT
jgi:hypothetical protein